MFIKDEECHIDMHIRSLDKYITTDLSWKCYFSLFLFQKSYVNYLSCDLEKQKSFQSVISLSQEICLLSS